MSFLKTEWKIYQGMPYYFFFYYIPNSCEKNWPSDWPIPTKESLKYQKEIWDFKTGKSQNLFHKVVFKLRQDWQNLEDIVFLCVPASTKEKNSKRYYYFSDFVCSKTGMENGFPHLHVIKDKISKHLGGTDKAELHYDDDFFKDKNILLFDDIITSGHSVNIVASNLKRLGSRIVGLMSLGRTYNPKYIHNKEAKHPWSNESVLDIEKYQEQNFDLRELVCVLNSMDFGDLKSAFFKTQDPKPTLPPIGSIVPFGKQENSPIEWEVLDHKSDLVLLISKYATKCLPFNDNDFQTSWKNCSLRQWLNDHYFNKVFSIQEQSDIQSSFVFSQLNDERPSKSVETSYDRLFILSESEYKKYYVEQKRTWKCGLNKGKSRPSWLRDSGQDQSHAAFIGKDGSIHLGGSLVNSQRNSVRPLMWVRWH